jgi:hypothetical protein
LVEPLEGAIRLHLRDGGVDPVVAAAQTRNAFEAAWGTIRDIDLKANSGSRALWQSDFQPIDRRPSTFRKVRAYFLMNRRFLRMLI